MKFYSYVWIRENDSPYYVGKGCGDRAFKKHTNGGRVLYPPKDRSRIFIFPQDSETGAFESERDLIWLFGRKNIGTGCLRNLTDGGENPPNALGKKRSAETRQKMSVAQKGHRGNWGSKRSEETKGKMSHAQIGKKHSPESISAMRLAHANISQETKDKISASLLGKPTYRRTLEIKQKMSEVGKLGWIKRRQRLQKPSQA